MHWTMASELAEQRQMALRADADRLRWGRLARRRRSQLRRQRATSDTTQPAPIPDRRAAAQLTPRTATCN